MLVILKDKTDGETFEIEADTMASAKLQADMFNSEIVTFKK